MLCAAFSTKGDTACSRDRKASSFNVCMMMVLGEGCGRCSLQQRKDILHTGFFQKHSSSPQTELLQGHSLYFWQLLFHKLMVVVVAAEEVEADA